MARAIAYEMIKAVAHARVEGVTKSFPLSRQTCALPRHVVLLAEPAQRCPDIGLVVRQGLGGDADPGVMQLADQDPDREPAGGDDLGWAVEPLRNLAQGA